MGLRSRRCWASSAFVVASALAVAACGSSSTGASNTTASTSATPTTNVNVVPTPFEMHQRFATGDVWEMTSAAAHRDGTNFTVTLDVTNTGSSAAPFDASTHGLFTLLNEYPSSAAPDPPQHALSRSVADFTVPGNGTHQFAMTFSGLPANAKHPVLWFHGHLLMGTQDASVWFTRV